MFRAAQWGVSSYFTVFFQRKKNMKHSVVYRCPVLLMVLSLSARATWPLPHSGHGP